jgi:uncharacterized protein involved in exopolysaccharide biosynthesis
VIEPPAGGDSRVATAVSPIYLESLKTYEHYASSDQLFAQAAERFHLRRPDNSIPIEQLKRNVLRVSVPRNTKVMEIAATHRDPKLAHAIALYVAEETVKLNRDTGQAGDADLAAAARQGLETATRRLRAAEDAYGGVSRRMPTPEALREELGRLDMMRTDVSRAALSIGLSYRGSEEPDKQMAQQLDSQGLALDRQAAARHELLARRSAEIGAAEAQLNDARARYEQARKRLDDLDASSGFRGERLSLLDPGVAPERPSSPNVPLNVFVGLALGAIFSLLYLTVEYSLRQQRAEAMREARWASSSP